MSTRPYLGYGLGLRTDHYLDILEHKPDIDWFEILSENYMVEGGKPLYYLDQIRQDYAMVMHGVSMSMGSTDPLDMDYLKQLKQLIDRVQPKWISDHLCWTGINGLNMHDLLPIPYTEESISHVADRISQIQDFLGQQILIENVSSYLTYKEDEMSEWEFVAALLERADCLMLFDINNIYVSSINHDFDAMDYIKGIPAERVYQYHLAGHTKVGDYIIDTHDQPVIDPVWDLYAECVKHFGPVSTMIERDDNIPPFQDLYAELMHAKQIAEPLLSNE